MNEAEGKTSVARLLSAVECDLVAGSEKGDPTEKQLKVVLEDANLWQKFKAVTNEMIVTKNGRRMFPVLKISVSGLDPNGMYSFLLDFVAADSHRWKYVNGEWIPAGKLEPLTQSCVYIHPESPNFGAHWMKAPISFSKVKLTNKANTTGQVILNSLHKYKPQVHIVRVGGPHRMISNHTFPETQFIAVTAYQNEEVTALKIKNNPFAKAFLDSKERVSYKESSDDIPGNHHLSYSHTNPSYQYHSALPLPSGAHTFHNSERYSSRCSHLATPYPTSYVHRNYSAVPFAENTNNLQALPGHDNWPTLPPPPHANTLPLTHASGTGSNSSQYTCHWAVGNRSVSPTNQMTSAAVNPQSPFIRGNLSLPTTPSSFVAVTSSNGATVEMISESPLTRLVVSPWSTSSSPSF
ncbi:T-box transcription factor TBX19-like isoform X3 [Hypanus sabinus]|uniref:T-box transcription factor TBX19-like isoform X3 n=1 Tax=Hypanus sabinus TaxID=79690 RepID=UPI0028C3D229|nr:T-box transcription factor TBX19-like isoform X3 [Hypanus sabinus]